MVARSVAIKASVVAQDEREGGMRKILNFGHTLGHALESESGFALRHGEAVGAGMVLEARLAERLGVADAGTATAIGENAKSTRPEATSGRKPPPRNGTWIASKPALKRKRSAVRWVTDPTPADA